MRCYCLLMSKMERRTRETIKLWVRRKKTGIIKTHRHSITVAGSHITNMTWPFNSSSIDMLQEHDRFDCSSSSISFPFLPYSTRSALVFFSCEETAFNGLWSNSYQNLRIAIQQPLLIVLSVSRSCSITEIERFQFNLTPQLDTVKTKEWWLHELVRSNLAV